jgi:transcription factor AP-1
MMETTMYDENNMMNGSLKQLKSKMTLDFNGSGKAKKLNNLLSSPDLNICTLASPELERIIIQQNGMVTTTPTPTQFLFPKAVTEEQEAYARGFINALEELKSQEKPYEECPELPVTSSMTTLQPVQSIHSETSAVSVAQSQHMMNSQPMTSQPMQTSFAAFTTTTSLPGNVMSSSAPMPTVVSSQQDMMDLSQDMMDLSRTSSPALMQQQQQPQSSTLTNHHQRVMQLKEEPQTVPCYNTPPISPVNMKDQERIKVDRKRARNRVAARKCRYRKLERISRLEERVKELSGQKSDLADNAGQLREQVARLKQQIMEHVNSGCKVMLNSNLL